MNLSDPHYSNSTLYQFAVGVSCPEKQFLITFSVPTGDSALVSKSFKVDVKDDKSRHSLMIFAPAKEIQTYKKGMFFLNYFQFEYYIQNDVLS